MSSSDVEFVPLATGDIHDDDEAVQQSYTASNPYPFPPAMEPIQQPHAKGRAKTRTFEGATDLTAGQTLRIVGQDDKRRALTVRMWSSTAADNVALGSSPSNNAFRLHPGDDGPPGLSEHTGEVWVQCVASATTVTVTWFGVSE